MSIDTIKSAFISLVWVASLSWSHALCTTPTPARLAWLRDFQPLQNFRPLFSRLAPMRVSVALLSMRGGIGSVDGAHGSFSTDAVEVRLDVHGMKCGGCAGRVRQLLEEELGVLKATVSLPAAMAVVSLDHKHANASSLLQKLKTKGFAASIAASSARGVPAHEQRQAHKAKECRALLSAVQLVVLLNVPTVAFALAPEASYSTLSCMLHALGLQSAVSLTTARDLVRLAQGAAALCTVGRRFYRSSYDAVRAGFANMDVLVALGATASFVFSSAAMLTRSCHVMFDTIPMLLFFQLCGRYLQQRADLLSAGLIDRLVAAHAPHARLLLTHTPALLAAPENIGEGDTVEVDAAVLRVGDVVCVRQGDTVPCDGVLLAAPSSRQHLFDAAMLTGESRPVAHAVGDEVAAGTRLLAADGNGRGDGGMVLVRAVRVGAKSTLGSMLELVERACVSAEASTTRGMVDRLAASMVPAVIALAVACGAWWWLAGACGWVGTHYFGSSLPASLQALMFATSTVMVSCPCALGLAAPLALVAGVGVAARSGVLIKSAQVLEAGAGVTHVIFDKTGTLTHGSPRVGRQMLLSCPQEEEEGEVHSRCGGGVLGENVAPVVAHVAAAMPQPGVSSSARALWAGIARAEYGVAHPLALALRMHAAQVLRKEMGVTGGGGAMAAGAMEGEI